MDLMKNGEIDLVINTPSGKREVSDAYFIRRAAVQHGIPYTTTVRGGYAVLKAIESYRRLVEEGRSLRIYALQDIHCSKAL